jgi:ADP-ribose pyrophosphatase YjhB (NUDIX family)
MTRTDDQGAEGRGPEGLETGEGEAPPSFSRRVPPGDDRERSVCDRCGFVAYENPKIVAGSVATAPDGRILLCRRAIEPRRGWWTLPAGYMEMGESVEEAARREAREEAGADLRLDRILAVYSVPRIGQVQVMFRAELLNPDGIAPGPESEALRLVPYEELPWDELAFPTVVWALRDWKAVRGRPDFAPFGNPVEGV